MSSQIFDQNRDPEIIDGQASTPDQQVADASGNIINPAREDGNLAAIKTDADRLDVNLSTRATETTLSGIKTGTDKIPVSPSQEHTTDVSPSSVRLTDGTTFYKTTTPSDTQPISAASLPLPTGAATESTLSTLNGKVTIVNTGAVTISTALPTGDNTVGRVKITDGTTVVGVNSNSSSISANLVDKDNTGNKQTINRFSEEQVTFRHNEFNDQFNTAAIDTTKWTVTTATGGTATIPNFGEAQLATTTTNGSQAKINTIIAITSLAGTDDIFRIVARLNSSTVTNNRTRIGMYDSATGNGFFFQYDGTNLTAVVAKSNSLTASSAIAGYTLTNYNTFQITYGANYAAFYINGTLVYTATATGTTSTLTNLIFLPIFVENFNTGTASTTNIVYVFGTSVYHNGVASHLPVVAETISQEATENGKTFSIASGIISGGGGNNTDAPVLYINNPSTSGKIVFLQEIAVSCTTNNRNSVFKLFANPTTVAAGSAATPTNTFIGNTTVSATTGDRVGTLTAVSNGTLVQNYGIAQNSSTGQYIIERRIIINPGNSILLTAQGIAGAIDVVVSMVWDEDAL